jgi:hypothetical protein
MIKKIILLAIGIVLMASVACAGPFLVCDPQTGVTSYSLTGPAWVPVTVTAQADGSIKMDVSAATVGLNSLTVAACLTDPVWGLLCSSTTPFVFTRPASPTIPANIKLKQ